MYTLTLNIVRTYSTVYISRREKDRSRFDHSWRVQPTMKQKRESAIVLLDHSTQPTNAEYLTTDTELTNER